MPLMSPAPCLHPTGLKALVLAAVLACSMQPAAAALGATQGLDLRSNVDFTTWSLFGSASASNFVHGNGDVSSILQLTSPGTGGQAGAGYAPSGTLINFNQAFEFNFFFFMAPGSVVAGDGMTFVITGDAPAIGTSLGIGGSGLGYQGSDAGAGSYALAIDTFHFDGEPVSPSIQIVANGSVNPLAATPTGLADIRDPSYFQWTGSLAYAPSGLDDEQGMLTGTINQFVGNQSFSVSANADWSSVGTPLFSDTNDYLGRTVYVGLTAGNGLADDGHFATSVTSAVPEPESYLMLLAGMALIGSVAWRRRRAPAASNSVA